MFPPPPAGLSELMSSEKKDKNRHKISWPVIHKYGYNFENFATKSEENDKVGHSPHSDRDHLPDYLQAGEDLPFFGPLKFAQSLGLQFLITRLTIQNDEIQVRATRHDGLSVYFIISAPMKHLQNGPFQWRGGRFWYTDSSLSFSEFENVGTTIAKILDQAIGKASPDTRWQDWHREAMLNTTPNKLSEMLDSPFINQKEDGTLSVRLDPPSSSRKPFTFHSRPIFDLLVLLKSSRSRKVILICEQPIVLSHAIRYMKILALRGIGNIILKLPFRILLSSKIKAYLQSFQSLFILMIDYHEGLMPNPQKDPPIPFSAVITNYLQAGFQLMVRVMVNKNILEELALSFTTHEQWSKGAQNRIRFSLDLREQDVNELPPPDSLIPLLTDVLDGATEHNLPIRIRPPASPPLCMLPDHLFHFEILWHSDDNLKPDGKAVTLDKDACTTCLLNKSCPGIWEKYLLRYGMPKLSSFERTNSIHHSNNQDCIKASTSMSNWEKRAKALLIDQPGSNLELGHMIPLGDELAERCIMPWNRIHFSPPHELSPCGFLDILNLKKTRSTNIIHLWNGPIFTAARRSLACGTTETQCPTECPYYVSKGSILSDMTLYGGSRKFVEHQITRVKEIIDGRDVISGTPMEIVFTPTTYCNYDCLMCTCGELGTREDVLPKQFYTQLVGLLDTIRILDISGGEPLASPIFREFLPKLEFSRYPHLRISMPTNGSLLTPKILDRMENIPFEMLKISLNASTAETYKLVNRGLSFARIRNNLKDLLRRREEGRFSGHIYYGMVLLRSNIHEIRTFIEMARNDNVDPEILLPRFNRNNQSIFIDTEAMEKASELLEQAADDETAQGRVNNAQQLRLHSNLLQKRLQSGILKPIPD